MVGVMGEKQPEDSYPGTERQRRLAQWGFYPDPYAVEEGRSWFDRVVGWLIRVFFFVWTWFALASLALLAAGIVAIVVVIVLRALGVEVWL
jgi:hypothetical protein